MTNDAPKRVNILPEYAKTLPTAEGRYIKGVWYVLEDHAQADKEAAVAAEREACAQEVDEYKMRADGRSKVSRGVGKHEAADRHERQSGAAVSIGAAIRARSNTDALERVRQKAKAEALREAADMAAFCLANPEGETLEDRQYAIVWRILALIPDQHKVDG